jgi:hypothetical protein
MGGLEKDHGGKPERIGGSMKFQRRSCIAIPTMEGRGSKGPQCQRLRE